MDEARPTWTGARLTARAPRIAVVIADDEHWDFWFRMALHQTGQVWGGSFAAVVPQRDGVVSPALVSAVQAYDPDHVVVLAVTDELRATTACSRVPFPARQASDAASLAARDALRSMLPTFRQRLPGGSETWLLQQLHVPVRRGPLSPAVHPRRTDLDPSVFLSCPSSWAGPLAAAVADRAGAHEAPAPRGADHPDEDDDVSDALAAWLLGEKSLGLPAELLHGPAARLSVLTADQPMAHTLSQHGLVEVTTGLPGPGLLVCGTTAEHAALARLWRLVHGRAWWFPRPPEHLALPRHWRAQLAVDTRRQELYQDGEPLLVVGADHLVGTTGWPGPLIAGDADWLAPVVAMAPTDLRWGSTTRALAAQGQFGVPHLLPVAVSDGTVTCQTPVPPALLTDPVLADRDELHWVIEVLWDDGRTLPQRPLDAKALLQDRHSVARTWVRPSRTGLSYASHDHGLQLAGVLPLNRLAQPRLVMPGLERWLRSAAAKEGKDVRPSEAGRRSRLLAARCGSREAYLELLAGPLLLALGLVEEARGTSDDWFQKGKGHGVCLDTGAVISWSGIRAAVPGDVDDVDVRALVDAACTAKLLRRGLVLQCAECTEIQFVRVEQIGQRWTCQRCDMRQHLQRSSWRSPLGEPAWFYDLHPVARRTLHERGDVPALLAAHWARKAAAAGRDVSTVEEVELVEGRKRLVEVDVIAFDGVLRVAECKSSTAVLPGADEIAKKCLFADVVHADELVFATTEAVWPGSFHRRVVGEVTKYGWSPAGPPAVRLISGLAPAAVDVLDILL